MPFSKLTSKEYIVLKFIIEQNNGIIDKNSVFCSQNKEIIKSIGKKGCIKYKGKLEIEVESLGRLEYNLYRKDVEVKFEE